MASVDFKGLRLFRGANTPTFSIKLRLNCVKLDCGVLMLLVSFPLLGLDRWAFLFVYKRLLSAKWLCLLVVYAMCVFYLWESSLFH